MKELVTSTYDIFVDFCDSGEYYDYYTMKPNNGVFDEHFLIIFIELVKNSMYSVEYEPIIKKSCNTAIKNIKKFSLMLYKQIEKGNGFNWKADEDLVINILVSLDKISSKTS